MTASISGSGQSVPLDDVVSALGDEHRRAALRMLDHTDGEPVNLHTLADYVAKQVDCKGRPADEHRRRVRIALHQMHLPKLAACGMIRYDAEANQVQGMADELGQELLAVIESHEASE